MLQRIVEIAEEGRNLLLSRGFLTVTHEKEIVGKVPLDDIAVLMISARSGYISKPLLEELAHRGAVTIICDHQYKPVFMGLPEAYTEEAVLRIKAQLTASLPLKKHLWRRIVKEKLKNQARVLEIIGHSEMAGKIRILANAVKSGDKGNKETWGARLYWKMVFGADFKREKHREGINALLNYGYTIIRSACARSIACCGLLPMFSLMHQNHRDYFALADDLMEPYRPIVDIRIKEIVDSLRENIQLTPEIKHKISSLIWLDVKGFKGVTPLINAIQDSALSLVDSFVSRKDQLFFPDLFYSFLSVENNVSEQV